MQTRIRLLLYAFAICLVTVPTFGKSARRPGARQVAAPAKPNLSLITVFLSHVGSERASRFHAYMDEVVPTLDYHLPWYIINSTLENETHRLRPPDIYRQWQLNTTLDVLSRQLVANFLFSINFSLAQQPPPRWLFRGTDDTFLNFRELPEYLRELEEKHDPLKDWVFLGNGINRGYYCYPQDGSGYLISQHTMRELARQDEALMHILDQPDEVAWAIWQHSKGIFGDSIASPMIERSQVWCLDLAGERLVTGGGHEAR